MSEPKQYFFVVSFASPSGRNGDESGAYAFPSGSTRKEAFEQIRQDVADRYFRGNVKAFIVTFFSLEPNQLEAGR